MLEVKPGSGRDWAQRQVGRTAPEGADQLVAEKQRRAVVSLVVRMIEPLLDSRRAALGERWTEDGVQARSAAREIPAENEDDRVAAGELTDLAPAPTMSTGDIRELEAFPEKQACGVEHGQIVSIEHGCPRRRGGTEPSCGHARLDRAACRA